MNKKVYILIDMAKKVYMIQGVFLTGAPLKNSKGSLPIPIVQFF